MRSLTELAGTVKQQCTGVFAEAENQIRAGLHDRVPTFGVLDREYAHRLLLACAPDKNYQGTMRKAASLLLPAPLRKLVLDPHGERKSTSAEILYVFHYPLHWECLESNINNCRTNGFVRPEMSSTEFLQQFRERHGDDISIIRMSIAQQSYILGRKEVMQGVMDFFKADADNVFRFMEELVGDKMPRGLEYDQRRKKQLHVYDLLRKPKEVAFELRK